MNIKQAKKLLEANGYTVEKNPIDMLIQKLIKLTLNEVENTLRIRNGIIKLGTKIIFYNSKGEGMKWAGAISKIDRVNDKTYFTIKNAVAISDSMIRIKTFSNIESKDILEIIV